MAVVFFFYERIYNYSVQDVGHFFRRVPYGNLTMATVCTEMLITEDVIWLFVDNDFMWPYQLQYTARSIIITLTC